MMMMMIKSLFYFICVRNIYYSKTQAKIVTVKKKKGILCCLTSRVCVLIHRIEE